LRTSLGNFLGPARPALFDNFDGWVVGPEIYDFEEMPINSGCTSDPVAKGRVLLEEGVVV